MHPDDSLIGQVVADRYQVVSRLGEGGMGRVYLAEHVRMGRKCALKVINPALATTADAISRFNREAANACKINHPNVAQVYDFGEMADGTLYLAMEYIEGDTLDAIIAREGALPPARAAQITKQIAEALRAAHHLGIVHRDLKPENVMVARHLDGSDWVKVVDFGIAKTVQRDGSGSQTVTTAGVSLGTPEYMSPEQLAGEALDHRTDIYSLGLLCFNALTGELPYPRVTSKETLVRRLIARPRTLAEVRPDVRWPTGLQRALDRALAPEVRDRYDNVADFGREVVAAVEPRTTGASAATTLVGAPVPASPMRRRSLPHHGPVARAVLRRALPWAIAAAMLLFAGALYAARRLHLAKRAVAAVAHDTTAARVAVVQQAVPAPVAPTVDTTSRSASPPPRPTPATSATLDRTPVKPARHASPAPNAKKTTPKHVSDTTRSTQPASPAPLAEDRSAAAAREIRAHITRMKERFEAGDMRGARQELGQAASMLAIARDLDPDPQQVMALQRELRQGVSDLIADCYRMRADSTLPQGIRCENLSAANRFRTRRQAP